jgi:hypothetical protein
MSFYCLYTVDDNGCVGKYIRKEDKEFSINARTDIPALVAEAERLRAEHDKSCADCAGEQEALIAHLTRERDAAVADLKEDAKCSCFRCYYHKKPSETYGGQFCSHPDGMCQGIEKWIWRGPQEGGGEA